MKLNEHFKTQLGTWYLGEWENVLPLISTKEISLIYTDPPYNFHSGGEKGFYLRPGKKTIMQKLEGSFGHKFNPTKLLKALMDFKEQGFTMNLYLWTNKCLIPTYLAWGKKNKLSFDILSWHKLNCPPLKKNSYLPDTEYCLFFRSKGAYFNSHLEYKKYKKYWLTSINTNRAQFHPCPKPLEITFNPIEISCDPAGAVLDMFAGTGTTAIVCERLGLKWICIEKEKSYSDYAKKGIIEESKQFKCRG